jgi:hypothetical protein
LVARYFRSIEHLEGCLEYVTVRVGGRDTVVPLGDRTRGRGVTFEVPRASLLKAIELRIFDDLLIGNFMRTTLHGSWPAAKLARDVTPYVAKYADNGGARTREELDLYFEEYRRRLGPARYLRHLIERQAKNVVHARFGADSPGASVASRAYRRLATRA